MKTRAKRLLSAAFVLWLIVVLANAFGGLTPNSIHTARYKAYPNDAPPECVFLGSSHLFQSVVPQLLYDEYGIVSHMVGAPCQTMYAANTMLKLLNTEGVKVAVMDLYMAAWPPYEKGEPAFDYARADKTMKYHLAAPAAFLPDYSLQKLPVMRDLWNQVEPYQQAFSPFLDQHSQILRLDRSNFTPSAMYARNLGYEYYSNALTKEPEPYRDEGDPARFSTDPDNVRELNKLIDLCKDRGIELVLAVTPFYATPAEERVYAEMESLAKERGVAFVPMQTIREQAGVAEYTNYSDPTHQNFTGAQKVTRFWGAYLTERYALTDARDAAPGAYPVFENNQYSYLARDAAYRLAEQQDLNVYLEELSKLDSGFLTLFVTEAEYAENLTAEQRYALGDAGFDIMELEQGYDFSLAGVNRGVESLVSVTEEESGRVVTNIDGHKVEIVFDQPPSFYSVIEMDDVRLTPEALGLKLVVYDLYDHRVVDRIVFCDTPGSAIIRSQDAVGQD